jgi:hypothetical protein
MSDKIKFIQKIIRKKTMKKIKFLFAISWTLITLGAVAMFGFGDDDQDTKTANVAEKTAEECEVPTYAKLIGHEDKWLLHNGCPPIDKSEEEAKEIKTDKD